MTLQNHLFSVTELNQVIKNVLEDSFYSIKLEGELSNFRPSASGHWYFSLKDRDSSISGVMFKNSTFSVNFRPKDGDKVKVSGKLTLYSQRGTYQIVCNSLTLFGEGDLLLMLEERKRKLASLGYFDPSKKKSLPIIPKTIGIISSPTGAALQDILKVLRRRHSLSNIIILPTLVQGSGASKTITKQIDRANSSSLCDVIILSRGGGSIEDLLPFSEEEVVMAISRSNIPIISGIGHEIDTSLADLASDIRAATPSSAAEIVTDGTENLYNSIINYRRDLTQNIRLQISNVRNKTKIFNTEYARRNLYSKIENKILYIDNIKKELNSSISWTIKNNRNRIETGKNTLNNLSPFRLFEKGYSWVSKDKKNILNQKLLPGDKVEIQYKHGKLTGIIEE